MLDLIKASVGQNAKNHKSDVLIVQEVLAWAASGATSSLHEAQRNAGNTVGHGVDSRIPLRSIRATRGVYCGAGA